MPKPPAIRSGPTCDHCKQQMGWIELLRTWGCRDCGYFLEYVCAGCGLVYEPPIIACPDCGGSTPPSHQPPAGRQGVAGAAAGGEGMSREQEMRDQIEADRTRPKVIIDGELRDGALAAYDLLAQLQQAQEELGRAHLAVESLRQSLTQLQPDYEECRAERDAAIERAEAAEEKLAHLEGKASDNDCPYLADKIRAERDAKEQRALLDRLFDYVMIAEGGFKDVSLANEVAAFLGAPAKAQERKEG